MAKLLLDQLLPEYYFSNKYEILISAAPETVFKAIKKLDMSGSFLIRTLFALRGMPKSALTINGLEDLRFTPLEEIENKELVLGLTGRFWTLHGDLQKMDKTQFLEFNRPGFAKAVWGFKLEKTKTKTRLVTETRIVCTDKKSLKKFERYWFFIRPFSGVIRTEILKSIKSKAESA